MRAVVLLGATGQRLKSGELAEALGTTTGFVPQVVGPLVKAGWVRSDPGPQGGYRLTVSPADLSVLAVIEAVDGPTDDGRCVVDERPCSAVRPCALHHAWSTARQALLASLSAQNLAALHPQAGLAGG